MSQIVMPNRMNWMVHKMLSHFSPSLVSYVPPVRCGQKCKPPIGSLFLLSSLTSSSSSSSTSTSKSVSSFRLHTAAVAVIATPITMSRRASSCCFCSRMPADSLKTQFVLVTKPTACADLGLNAFSSFNLQCTAETRRARLFVYPPLPAKSIFTLQMSFYGLSSYVLKQEY
uniref:HDC13963 n=1 Tax=Drosophila melanogaster TaxID=7227 RepID=Q6IJY7_DROME|nr:TPA_inf: HDC13963 [Drosophila melanogaster]